MDFRGELEIGEHQIHAKRNPDLRHHGVSAGAQECLDFQVLLNPLEEQLDLPALFVASGNGVRRETEVITQKDISPSGVRIPVNDATQPRQWFAARLGAGQLDALIADQTLRFVDRTTLHDTVASIALLAADKENPLICQGRLTAVVVIALVDQ